MEFLGKGLAFCALVIAATVLEIKGKEVDEIWLLVACWAIFGTWHHSKKCECKDECDTGASRP